jgi:hypothetical protein
VSGCVEDAGEAGVVVDAGGEDGDAGGEEGHACVQGGDAAA